jgi:hypothetical protein
VFSERVCCQDVVCHLITVVLQECHSPTTVKMLTDYVAKLALPDLHEGTLRERKWQDPAPLFVAGGIDCHFEFFPNSIRLTPASVILVSPTRVFPNSIRLTPESRYPCQTVKSTRDVIS